MSTAAGCRAAAACAAEQVDDRARDERAREPDVAVERGDPGGGDRDEEISSERPDMIETDLVVILTFDVAAAQQQLVANSVFQKLAAVQEGRVLYVPYEEPAIRAALSFNTVLTVRTPSASSCRYSRSPSTRSPDPVGL